MQLEAGNPDIKTVAEAREVLCIQPWAEFILTGFVSGVRGSVTQIAPQEPPARRWASEVHLLYHIVNVRQGDATRGESVTPRHQCVPEKNWPSVIHFGYPQGRPEPCWSLMGHQGHRSLTKRSKEQVWWGRRWFLFLILQLFPTMPTQNPP